MISRIDIFILGGARTPMADYAGSSRTSPALELGAIAARAALRADAACSRSMVDHVVFGNVLQTSADAIYGARHVGAEGGVPIEVPGADGQPAVRVGHPGRHQRRRS